LPFWKAWKLMAASSERKSTSSFAHFLSAYPHFDMSFPSLPIPLILRGENISSVNDCESCVPEKSSRSRSRSQGPSQLRVKNALSSLRTRACAKYSGRGRGQKNEWRKRAERGMSSA